MAKCSGCGRYLSSKGAVVCTTCPGMFHNACVGIPDNKQVSADWSCPECKKIRRKGDNTATPVKGIVEPSATGSDQESTVATPTCAVDTEIRDMRRELAAYMSELREFRNEIRLSLSTISDRMDRFEQRLQIVEQRDSSADAHGASAEVVELQATVEQLKREMNDKDQDALQSDLDIGQLPEEKGENTVHVVTVLAAKLGIKLEQRDIVFAERVGATGLNATAGDDSAGGRGRRIVVRLARHHLRDEFLRAARVRRNLNSGDMNLPGPPRRIYVNERLTRANRLLFRLAREESRKRQWRYTWTRRGRVFVRQADGKQAYQIRTDKDLHQVFVRDTV